MLRAVLFDMDDTLLDWSRREGTWLETVQNHLRPVHTYLENEGHAVPDLTAMSRAYGDVMRMVWEAVGPPDWLCPSQIDVLGGMLRGVNLDPARLDMARVERQFGWGPIPGVRLYNDSLPVLKTLRDAKIKTGLITNAVMPMWMRDGELEQLGVLDYLDVRLTAGDVGRLKPHPLPFQTALKRLKIKPEQAVFVGDRVQDDIAGAQAAGMRAIWIKRKPDSSNGAYTPDAVIETLTDLLDTLDGWYPGWRNGRKGRGKSR